MRTREAARREAKKARNKEVREEKAKEKAKEAAKSKGRKSSESKKKRGKAASKTVSQPEPEPAPEAHERTPPLTPPPEIPPEELERCIRDLMEVKAETGLPLNYLLDRGYENLDRERDEMEAEPSQRFTGVYDEGSGEEDAVGADGSIDLEAPTDEYDEYDEYDTDEDDSDDSDDSDSDEDSDEDGGEIQKTSASPRKAAPPRRTSTIERTRSTSVIQETDHHRHEPLKIVLRKPNTTSTDVRPDRRPRKRAKVQPPTPGSGSEPDELEAPVLRTRKKKVKTTEDKPLELAFSIPHDGAHDELTFNSATSFDKFKSDVADTMSVSPKHVRVAYQFSISPKSDGYQHLSTEDQWKKLFISASDAISRTTSKKPFVVVIKDLNLEAGKGKGKGGSASAGGRRNAKKVGSKRKRDSTDESSSDDALEKSTRERDTSQKPKSALQWKVRLERDLHCVEHNRPCVKIDGTCYPIQHDEMSHWSLFCANGYPSTTSPPPKLVIKAAADRNGGSGGRQGQKTASATPATTAGPGSNPTNVQAPPAPVMGGFYPMAQMHMGYGMAAPPAPYMPPYPPFPYGPWSGYEPHRGSPYRTRDGRDIRDRDLSLSPHRSRGLRRDPYDIPGSDPIEDDAEDPSAFPLLTEWLAGLDQHPQRGIDQHNFGQFADEFTQKKYYRILDLEDKSAKDIRLSICPGMVEGTADKLARYIKQDLAAIRKKLRNMARQESSQRSGYY